MRRAYAGLLLWLTSCNPTAGLADSADAAAPEIKRYFDGRGSQLSEGPWNRVVVDLDPDTLYHLGARRLDDREPTFHLFGADARDGCEVTPNAGTWLMGKPALAPFRVLPFLEDIDEHGHGRLRFTGLDCKVQDLAIEDAGRPYSRLYDHGYLVPAQHGFVFADPWQGSELVLASDVKGILAWDSAVLLDADGTLKSFSGQFEPGPAWGNTPVAVVPLQTDYLVEDADGVHRVTFDREPLAIEHEPVLPDVCGLQQWRGGTNDDAGTWVAAQAPCGSKTPSLLHLDLESVEVLDTVELPFEVDSRHVRALVTGATGEARALAGVVYLTDVGDDGLGALWSWQLGEAAPTRLAERADLDSIYLLAPGGDWDGSAQVNQQPIGSFTVHDWLRFRWDGTTSVAAEHVLQDTSSGDTLVNFDGVTGDLPSFDGDGYRVLARGVPPSAGEIASYTGARHYSRVVELDGQSGRLLLGTEEGEPSSWTELGRGVPPDQVRFSWFMPALVFLENWDAESETGTLVAYNYELDARATLAEGVSSFDLTSYPLDGVVYAVPRGKERGIWFSKAK